MSTASPPSSFPLPSDTRHLNIESRQYKLLGVDLGHGWPRAVFKVGAWFFIPWWILLWRLGMPLFANGALLVWLGPPALLTMAAFTKDAGGRYRLYAWIDRVTYLTRRPRPIVNGGLTPPASPRPIRSSVAFLIAREPAPTPDTDGDPRAQVA